MKFKIYITWGVVHLRKSEHKTQVCTCTYHIYSKESTVGLVTDAQSYVTHSSEPRKS